MGNQRYHVDMEKTILQCATDVQLEWEDGTARFRAWERLTAKFDADPDSQERGELMNMLVTLVANGMVLDQGGRSLIVNGPGGITPAGVERLFRLEHRTRYWLGQHSVAIWAATAATIAAISSLAILAMRFIS